MEWLSVINKQYDPLAEQVAQAMRSLGKDHKTSPYEALNDPWEEFAFQIQEEESYLYDAYELTIDQIAEPLLDKLDVQDTMLLWIVTPEAFDASEIPCRGEMKEAILMELRGRVRNLASNENLDHFYEWQDAQEQDDEADDEPDDNDEVMDEEPQNDLPVTALPLPVFVECVERVNLMEQRTSLEPERQQGLFD